MMLLMTVNLHTDNDIIMIMTEDIDDSAELYINNTIMVLCLINHNDDVEVN